MRRALLVTLALAVLNAGPAGAQQREHGRFPRKWLMAGIGAVVGAVVGAAVVPLLHAPRMNMAALNSAPMRRR